MSGNNQYIYVLINQKARERNASRAWHNKAVARGNMASGARGILLLQLQHKIDLCWIKPSQIRAFIKD